MGQIAQILGIGAFLISLQLLLVLAAGNITLYISPADQTVKIGQSFSAKIRLSSGDSEINYVRTYLSFPSDKLIVTAISSAGSSFNEKIEETFNNTDGTVKIQRYNHTARTGDNLIATITFQAKKAGDAKVAFQTSSMATNQNGSNRLTSTKSASYTITTSPQPVPPPKPAPISNTPIQNPQPTPAIASPAPTSPSPAKPPVRQTTAPVAVAPDTNPGLNSPGAGDSVGDNVSSTIAQDDGSTSSTTKDKSLKFKLIGAIVLLGVLGYSVVLFLKGRAPRSGVVAVSSSVPLALTPEAKAASLSVAASVTPETVLAQPKPIATPKSSTPVPTTSPRPIELHPHSQAPDIKPVRVTEPVPESATQNSPDEPQDMFDMAEKRFESDERLKNFRDPDSKS